MKAPTNTKIHEDESTFELGLTLPATIITVTLGIVILVLPWVSLIWAAR